MKITENRGYGISYPVFEGTEEECQIWMAENTIGHPMDNEIRVSKDPEDVNGNGQPFTYHLEEEGVTRPTKDGLVNL